MTYIELPLKLGYRPRNADSIHRNVSGSSFEKGINRSISIHFRGHLIDYR